MPKTILVHSFRHGVGRTNIAANLAYLLAAEGQRVGIIDTDLTAPSLHCIFGVSEKEITCSFTGYLTGACSLEQVVYPLADRLNQSLDGALFFVPGTVGKKNRAFPPDAAVYVEALNAGCQELGASLNLDTILIDTQPGLDKNTLVSLTVADTLVVIMRHDWRDYQGTGVTIDVVKQLEVPEITLIINEVPAKFDFGAMKTELETTYNCQVSAILPHIEAVMALGNKDIFAMHYPTHPATALLRQAAIKLAA